MDEIELVLTQLAIMHSASYHYLKLYPGGFDAFKGKYEVRAFSI